MSAVAERSVEIERRVAGNAVEAFAYFTDPAKHLTWQGTSVELDPRPGGAYVVHFNERTRVRGQYLVVDPPRRLVLTWGWESVDEFPEGARELAPGSTTVDISFIEDGEETIIRIRHTGLPTEAASGLTTSGWSAYLDRLTAVLAGEEPGSDPLPPYLATLSAAPPS